MSRLEQLQDKLREFDIKDIFDAVSIVLSEQNIPFVFVCKEGNAAAGHLFDPIVMIGCVLSNLYKIDAQVFSDFIREEVFPDYDACDKMMESFKGRDDIKVRHVYESN